MSRSDTIAVGGQPVETVVISVVIKGTGDITFEIHETDWVAKDYGLIVRIDQTGDGSYGPYTFRNQTSQILDSLKPS